MRPRDAYTDADEEFVLVGHTTATGVNFHEIAHELGEARPRLERYRDGTRRGTRLVGRGINRSGQLFRFALERHSPSHSRPQAERVEVVRLTTPGLPRQEDSTRTALLEGRAIRLHRLREAGLRVIRTVTHLEGANRYRIVDHLRLEHPTDPSHENELVPWMPGRPVVR